MGREGAAAAVVAAAWLTATPAAAQVPDVIPPRTTHDEGVVYPDQAVRDGVSTQTTVVLRLTVDANGLVTEVEVETPRGHGFDEASLAAARTLRFAPATRDGIPVACRIRYRYVFAPAPAAAPAPAPAPAPAAAPALAPASASAPASAPASALASASAPAPAPAPAFAPDLPPDAPEEVVVQGRPVDVDVARRSLSGDEAEHLPGARGDALASLEAMPGVGHAPPLSGLLILRGSGPNDTNVFVDGTGINLPYHLGGLSAVIPSEVLERLDLHPGNYGAQYGRGMGGVVEFGIRPPRDDGRLHGLVQADAIEARALAEGPIGGGWRLLAAARRSTVDLWLDPLLAGRGTPTFVPRYYDAQLEAAKDFDSRRSLRLLLFGYDDQLGFFQGSNAPAAEFAGAASEHIAFAAAQLRYVDRYAPSGELRVMASVGRDIARRGEGIFFYDIEQTPIDFRADVSQRLLEGVRIEAGLDAIYAPYTGTGRAPALADPDVPSGGPSVMPLQATVASARFEPAGYVQGILAPWRGCRVVPSVRLDHDSGTDRWDTAPRITLRQDLPSVVRRTTLKAAAGEYFQPPQIVEIAPVFGQTGLSSNRSVQYDAGIEQEVTDEVDASVDVYDKWMDRLVVPGAGNAGEGRAYGVEWLLRYKADSRFFGWIAYTLSRSERRDATSQPFYAFDYDQTHNVSVVASWRIDDRWRVGGRFRFVSGTPYTPDGPGAFDASSATYLPTPALVSNGSRLPPFHELDVRVDRSWRLGDVRLSTYVDVENVYSYGAPIATTYSFDYTRHEFAGGLPILPSIGLRGEL
ncbi:MAG TPA: TonB family protein [Polyangiaceae bacterium]|nr:TonB family protein [Polyangiaceae bacterium]